MRVYIRVGSVELSRFARLPVVTNTQTDRQADPRATLRQENATSMLRV